MPTQKSDVELAMKFPSGEAPPGCCAHARISMGGRADGRSLAAAGRKEEGEVEGRNRMALKSEPGRRERVRTDLTPTQPSVRRHRAHRRGVPRQAAPSPLGRRGVIRGCEQAVVDAPGEAEDVERGTTGLDLRELRSVFE